MWCARDVLTGVAVNAATQQHCSCGRHAVIWYFVPAVVDPCSSLSTHLVRQLFLIVLIHPELCSGITASESAVHGLLSFFSSCNIRWQEELLVLIVAVVGLCLKALGTPNAAW